MLLLNALPYLNRDAFDYQVGYFLPWKDALVGELEGQGLRVTCFGSRSAADVAAVWKVYRHLRNEQISVLHAHLPWAGLVGRTAARWAGTPATIYTEHGLWSRLNPLMRWANRVTLNWNDTTIAVSDDVARSMSAPGGHSIETIVNGLDCEAFTSCGRNRADFCEEFDIPEDAFIVGKVANLSPVKNHELLITAFARLCTSRPHARLVLVGQLRDREHGLMTLAAQLGVEQKVVMTGPRSDVSRLVDSFDVFAMSSSSEGLPVSLLEAMALAKPVVCTAVGGIPGVVRDGIDGYLVPPGDAALMTRRLDELARDAALCRRLGAAGREHVRQNFSAREMTRRVEALYQRLLKEVPLEPASVHA